MQDTLVDRWVAVLVDVDEVGSELTLDPRYRVGLAKAPGAVNLDDPDLLRIIKAAPGPVSLASRVTEIDKPTAIGSFGLPEGLFQDVAPRVLKEWRDQVMAEPPGHARDHHSDLQVALLAALLFCRREITDALVNLLISTVRRIGARAERRVTTELVNAFKRVQGKEGLLSASPTRRWPRRTSPCGGWCSPSSGKTTCGTWSSSTSRPVDPVYRRTVRTTYRASYTATGPG